MGTRLETAAIYRDAKISECGQYRYVLSRQWVNVGELTRWVCFIGLNPSTADAEKDDQTIRKLIGFTQRWGYDGFKIVNLYGFRSRHPNVMRVAAAPVGPMNEQWLVEAAREAKVVVACWGNHATAKNRGPQVIGLLRSIGIKPKCFGKTADGYPKHPLMLPYETELCDL